MQFKLFAATVALTASLSLAAPVQRTILSLTIFLDFIVCLALLIKFISRLCPGLGFNRWSILLHQI